MALHQYILTAPVAGFFLVALVFLVSLLAAGLVFPAIATTYSQRYFAGTTSETPSLRTALFYASAMSAASLAIGWQHPVLMLLPSLAASFALSGSAYIDRRFLLIPDRFHLCGLGAALLWHALIPMTDLPLSDLIYGPGMVVALWIFGSVYEKVTKKTAMGFGDIKLLGWISLFCGSTTLLVILAASALGLLSVAINSLAKRRLGSEPIPFGPALACATVFVLMLQ